MAYCIKPGDDQGFATPAATVASLAIAIVASAFVGAALSDLKASRIEEASQKAEYDLSGLQERAGLVVVTNPRQERLRWRLPAQVGTAEVLAEPEAAKLPPASAADIGPDALARLRIDDPATFRRNLDLLTIADAVSRKLEQADGSPLWSRCGRSLVSPYGAAKSIALPPARAPTTGDGMIVWRSGEVWRIRVTGDGWVDDRIVRFTADALHPAGIISRRFYPYREGGSSCEALFANE